MSVSSGFYTSCFCIFYFRLFKLNTDWMMLRCCLNPLNVWLRWKRIVEIVKPLLSWVICLSLPHHSHSNLQLINTWDFYRVIRPGNKHKLPFLTKDQSQTLARVLSSLKGTIVKEWVKDYRQWYLLSLWTCSVCVDSLMFCQLSVDHHQPVQERCSQTLCVLPEEHIPLMYDFNKLLLTLLMLFFLCVFYLCLIPSTEHGSFTVTVETALLSFYLLALSSHLFDL